MYRKVEPMNSDVSRLNAFLATPKLSRRQIFAWSGALGATLAFGPVGCARGSVARNGFFIHGAYDLQALGRAIGRAFTPAGPEETPSATPLPTATPTPGSVVFEPSEAASAAQGSGQVGLAPPREAPTSSIADLKSGRAQAVLLGREPTEDELRGVKDTVIAYDAICVLLDGQSYKGGENRGGTTGVRTDGLKDVTLEELKTIFGAPILPRGSVWKLNGRYDRVTRVSGSANDPTTKPTDFDWVAQPNVNFQAARFPKGKYDTQGALFQILGLDEAALTRVVSKDTSFTAIDKATEEEVLASIYPDLPPGFPFYFSLASIRTARLALKHVNVKALAVTGADPLGDPKLIYEGKYPLGRRIHLLIRDPGSADTDTLLTYLLSPDGQQTIADAGYLPLPAAS